MILYQSILLERKILVREDDKSYNVSDRRNYNLDLLRIMACIAVIGLHTSSNMQYKNIF